MLAWPTALVLDQVFGTDVTFLLSTKSAEEQAEWRELRDPKDDVAEIYGQPVVGGTRRILLPGGDSDARLIIPAEDPERRLLITTGTDVWDARLVNAMGAFVSALALLAAAVLWWRRQRLS